jgi:hypothetical protein
MCILSLRNYPLINPVFEIQQTGCQDLQPNEHRSALLLSIHHLSPILPLLRPNNTKNYPKNRTDPP